VQFYCCISHELKSIGAKTSLNWLFNDAVSGSQHSSIGIATDFGLGGSGWIPRIPRSVQTGSGPTHPPINAYRGPFLRGIKRQERVAYHSPPSSAEVLPRYSSSG
jgi:hypothetical protein